MINRTKSRTALLLAASTWAMAASVPAFAQSADSSDEILVTGQRERTDYKANADIPRSIDDVQAYAIVDRETVLQSGATSIGDFLKNHLPQSATALSGGQKAGLSAGAGNSSAINLRGLGTDRTLILVNGRRQVGFDVVSQGVRETDPNGVRIPTGIDDGILDVAAGGLRKVRYQADINRIPVAAIERIEILPSSGSAIYGGAALGGVVNVILKRDYEGGELAYTFNVTEDGKGPTHRIEGAYGFRLGDDTSVNLFGSLTRSKALQLGDRRGLVQRGLDRIANHDVVNGLTGQKLDLFDFLTPVNIPNQTSVPTRWEQNLGLDSQVLYFGGGVLHRFNDWIEAYANVSAGYSESSYLYNPVQSQRFVTAQDVGRPGYKPRVDYFDPYNPAEAGDPVVESIRHLDTKNRSEASSFGYDLGLTFKLPYGWNASADYSHSEASNKAYGYGYGDFRRTFSFEDFQFSDPFPSYNNFNYEQSNYIKAIAVRASGPLGLKVGDAAPASLAVALEHRVEGHNGGNIFIHGNQGNLATATFFFESDYIARDSTIDSAYAELSLPLFSNSRIPGLHNLELQLAGRLESHEAEGGWLAEPFPNFPPSSRPRDLRFEYRKGTYTAGFKWEPVPSIAFRASYATAFQPPRSEQLTGLGGIGIANAGFGDDLYFSGSDLAVDRYGNRIQNIFPVFYQADLKPEQAVSQTLGVIWQPQGVLTGLRFNVEYFRIKERDIIATLTNSDIANDFPERILYNADNRPIGINRAEANLYRRDTRGFDVNISYRLDSPFGAFSLDGTLTQFDRRRIYYNRAGDYYDTVGSPNERYGVIKRRGLLSLNWNKGSWAASWTARYTGSYKQWGAEGGRIWTLLGGNFAAVSNNQYSVSPYVTAQGSDTIPSQTYHDLFVGYRFEDGSPILRGLTLQGGINNVFDKDPPIDVFHHYNAYSSPYGDVRGRSFWLSLRKAL